MSEANEQLALSAGLTAGRRVDTEKAGVLSF